MLAAPLLDDIVRRLRNVHLDEWGPDGVRYISILFWDELGYRLLANRYSGDDWERWHHSSGQFWDLFLAGCYAYESRQAYGSEAGILATRMDGAHPIPFYWSQSMASRLARDIELRSAVSVGAPPWSFTGPVELFVVGARRAGGDIEIDWAGARGVVLDVDQLSAAVGYYTEAHIANESTIVPSTLPSPGDFEDSLPRELLADLKRQIPLLFRLFRMH